ncbi:MAG TPA: VanZ family protein [Nitrospirota bacterium]|nr:VanZ family protein [Nitrospirota bacterium]
MTVTRRYRILLAMALCVISYLSTTTLEVPVVQEVNDKLEHVLAFSVLALLADFSWPESGFGAAKILSLLAYGLAIEITQYFIPYRECSLFDLGADAAGLLLYGLMVPLLMKVNLLKGRWRGEKPPR